MVVEKGDLRARVEVVGVVGVGLPHGEVVGRREDRARRTREVDREVGETRGCKHWRKGGWGWSRQRRR